MAVSRTGPGKTGPRIEQDLLDYDGKKPRNDGYNVLFDPPPIYTAGKIYPLRKLPGDCYHHFWLKSEQTNLHPFDQAPTEQTRDIAAVMCSRCLQHYDIEVNYSARPRRSQPCHLGTNFPMHHWLPFINKTPTDDEKENAFFWKFNSYRERYQWVCSAPDCPAVLNIRISPPRLNKKQAGLLTNPSLVYIRGEKVIRNDPDPERFGDSRPSEPCQVLMVLRTYLIHALQLARGERRKIMARNKRFMLAFGDDCDELLRYLGFDYVPGDADSNDPEEAHWLLPDAYLTGKEDGQKGSRQFLQDVIMELVQMLEQCPPAQLKKNNCEVVMPASGLRHIRVALGCLNYPTDSRTVTNLDVDEHPHYAGLGAVSNFSDQLIFFAYDRQRSSDNNPQKIPYYLECLKGIGAGRNSPFLQEEYVKRASMGEYTSSEIENAYKFFALNPAQDQGDEHIIGVYSSRIENAPLQKERAKHELAIIGYARNSQRIQEAASDKAMTYEEALARLQVPADAPADTIEAAAVALSMDTDRKTVGAMLTIIGDTRGELSLQMAGAAMQHGDGEALQVGDAYSRLQIKDPNASDESVFTYFQTLSENAPAGTKDSYLTALRIIARARNSHYLFAKMANPEARVAEPRSTADNPVGLDNIGNTCYLNSLLQYYYTIKAVRNVVMNLDEYRMPLDNESLEKKRVGGRAVKKDEVIRGQKFVEELRSLYQNLKSASSQSVRPTQELAELTLVSEETDEKWRRQSISSPSLPRNIQVGLASPPPIVPLRQPPPPIPEIAEDRLSTENEDVDMTDAPAEADAADDAVSMAAKALLVNQDGTTDRASSATQQPEVLPDSKVASGQPAVGSSEVEAQTAGIESASVIDDRPPLPTRHNKPAPIQTTSEADDRIRKVSFGAQQDVTEVIGNVMFSLQCAIRPTALDPKFGDQIDSIRETFYGTDTKNLKKGGVYDVHEEHWPNLLVYPSNDGEKNIYEALDDVYDERTVELDKSETTSFSSVKKLPPILQIQIQRTAFDMKTQQASKNTNPIKFYETLFMDRYLDNEKVLQRRKEAWKWKGRLRQLEARRNAIKSRPSEPKELDVVTALINTKEFLTRFDSKELDELGVSKDLGEAVESRAAAVGRELEMLEEELDTLKKKVREQFMDMRQHRYHLQSVFIHRGTNSYGHYWIYIYDFQKDVWREYNDERVSLVSDTKYIYDQIGGATPYYLVYVREDQKDELVDAVCRELSDTPQETTAVALYQGDAMDEDVAEIQPGAQHIENYEPKLDPRREGEVEDNEAWQNMQASTAAKDLAQAS